jgi:competence protein ComEC
VIDTDLPKCCVLVSTRGCDYNAKAGDLMTWPAALEDVQGTGNPYEMDYAMLMLHGKGIRYQQHLPASQVKKTGYSPTLFTRLANVRRSMANKVFNSMLSPDAQHFVVALLLGDSHYIDKATRSEFSSAGIAHVLALSGLHVGLIALLIYCLLFPLDYIGLKKLRLVITLGAIALFAVFTGLSPSVVRATVMTGFVFASLVFHRRSVPLNALAMAALVILVFSPSDLFNMGFQLSFITVGSILLFARVPERLRSDKQWVNHLTTTVITSAVAMLSTVALTAYYFHNVSLMSVIANVLVLMLMPVFMVLATVMLLVTAAGLEWPVLNRTLDAIYQYFHGVARMVNAMPLSHVSGVYVSAIGVVLYFVIMGFVIQWLYSSKRHYLALAGIALLVALAHWGWLQWHTPRRGCVVFNSYTSTPVLYYNSGKGYVWIPDNEDTDLAEFERHHAGFLARYNIGELTIVPEDSTLAVEGALFKPPYAQLMGHRVLAVGRGHWKSATTDSREAVDDIILTKRYHSTASKLRELYQFKRLIISGAQQADAIQSMQHECDTLGIHCHALATQGAVIEEQ